MLVGVITGTDGSQMLRLRVAVVVAVEARGGPRGGARRRAGRPAGAARVLPALRRRRRAARHACRTDAFFIHPKLLTAAFIDRSLVGVVPPAVAYCVDTADAACVSAMTEMGFFSRNIQGL